MCWLYIPAIYFFIGPCMALVLNLAPSNMRSIFTAWSGLVGNVFNLIVAPQVVGLLSDWFAAGARFGCGVTAPGTAGAGADRILGDVALHSRGQNGHRGRAACHRLRAGRERPAPAAPEPKETTVMRQLLRHCSQP